MNRLAKKLRAVIVAEDAVIVELQRLYPVDSEIRCMLMHGQINPSRGRVIGHNGGRFGIVIVRLDSRAQDVRRVPVENLL